MKEQLFTSSGEEEDIVFICKDYHNENPLYNPDDINTDYLTKINIMFKILEYPNDVCLNICNDYEMLKKLRNMTFKECYNTLKKCKDIFE